MCDELYGVKDDSLAVRTFLTRVIRPAIALAVGGHRVRIAVGEGCPIWPVWYLIEKELSVYGYTVRESSFGFNGTPEYEERSIKGASPFSGRICVVAHTPWTNCEPRAQYAMTFDGMDLGQLMVERKAELEADDAEGGE